MRYTALIVGAVVLMIMPGVALTQTSLSVEEVNKRLQQEYWRGFEAQVERRNYLRNRNPSVVIAERHFGVKCWEDGELRVDEESTFVTGFGSGFFEVLLSDGRFMLIHEGGGLCVLEEQPGPSLQ